MCWWGKEEDRRFERWCKVESGVGDWEVWFEVGGGFGFWGVCDLEMIGGSWLFKLLRGKWK